MELEDIAIRSGYMPRYPTGDASAIVSVARSSRNWGTKLLLAFLVLLVVFQVAFIAGTSPYWYEILAHQNPISVLWQNLNSGAGNRSDATRPTPAVSVTEAPESYDVERSTAEDVQEPGAPPQSGKEIAEIPVAWNEQTPVAIGTISSTPSGDAIVDMLRETASVVPTLNTSTPTADTLPQASATTASVTTLNLPTSTASRGRGSATPTVQITTSTPLPTATPQPTPRPRIQQASPPSNLSIDLLSPAEGAALSGSVIFMWRSSGSLPEGYGYEVFRWDQGASRALGQAMAQPTTSTSQRINLDVLGLIGNQTYFWGVRLVRLGARSLAEADPRFLGDENGFIYRVDENSDSGNDVESEKDGKQ